MRSKLLAFTAAAALGGCSLGHDGEQIVRKDPATVYAAVDSAFSAMADAGNSGAAAEKGQSATVKRVENKSLDLKVTIDGKQAMRLVFGFEPANGGKETKMTGDWDIDQGVIRDSIRRQGGGEMAMPPLPQFALDAAMQKLLREMARKIEAGEMLDTPRNAMAMTSSPSYSPGNSEWERRMASARATAPTGSAAPMMDPDAAAESYLPPSSSSR